MVIVVTGWLDRKAGDKADDEGSKGST